MNRPTIRVRNFSLLALLILVLTPAAARAQSCAPPDTQPGVSITRDQYLQDLREYFAFEEPEPGQRGGTVTMADRSDITTLNGLLMAAFPTRYVRQLIFERLATRSPIDGTPVPQLADSWEISDDGLTYTFHLSEREKWHDNADFTAEDVEFSYDVALKRMPNRLEELEKQIEMFKALDDDTFVVKTHEPMATFLWEGPASIFIVPKHIWESVEVSKWSDDPGSSGEDPKRVIGTGPFEFFAREEGQSVTLVGNETHYSTPPFIERFVFKVVENSQLDDFLKNETVDISEAIDVNTIQDAYNAGRLEYRIFAVMSMHYLAFNTARPPLDDVRVRQALFVGLDREEIISRINLGYGEVAVGTQPPMSFAYAPDTVTDPYAFDQDRARALLKQAGWTDTNDNGIVDKDGHDLWLTLINNADAGGTTELVAEITRQWRQIGVQVMSSTERLFADIVADLNEGWRDFDVLIRFARFGCDGNQRNLFHSTSVRDMNVMGWKSEEYDELDDQQRRELDPMKRRALLVRLSSLAWDDLPVGILRFFMVPIAWNASLHNVAPNDLAGPYWSVPFMWKESNA